MKSEKVTSPGRIPPVVRRALTIAGGLFAFGVLAVATSGTADAQPHDGGSPLTAVTGTVGSLLKPLTPVVRAASEVVAPVVKPLVRIAAPVLGPVLRPFDAVAAPVVAAVGPLVSPIATPIVHAASPVLAPATTGLGASRTITAATTTTANGRTIDPIAAEPVGVQATTTVVVLPSRVGVVESAVARHPIWAAAMTYPSPVATGDSSGIPYGPDVPGLPMAGGATGAVSSGATGGGVAGAVLVQAVGDIGVGQLNWSGGPGHVLGPHWCYVFGRNHPS